MKFLLFLLFITSARALDNGLALTPVKEFNLQKFREHLLCLNFVADGMDVLGALQMHN